MQKPLFLVGTSQSHFCAVSHTDSAILRALGNGNFLFSGNCLHLSGGLSHVKAVKAYRRCIVFNELGGWGRFTES